jgi:hypothetical protein
VTTTPIDVEGGSEADCILQWGTPTGTPTLDAVIEASLDGGSTWKRIGVGRRQYTVLDVPLAGQNRFRTAIPIGWIPRPTGADAYAGSQLRTKVRAVLTVAGGSPVFPNMMAFLTTPLEGAASEFERL